MKSVQIEAFKEEFNVINQSSVKVAEHRVSGWPAVLRNTARLSKIKTNMAAKSVAKIFFCSFRQLVKCSFNFRAFQRIILSGYYVQNGRVQQLNSAFRTIIAKRVAIFA